MKKEKPKKVPFKLEQIVSNYPLLKKDEKDTKIISLIEHKKNIESKQKKALYREIVESVLHLYK